MNYDEFVAIFRDCNMGEGKTIEDVYVARKENLRELRSNGFNHHSRVIIPGAGVPAGIGAYDFMMLSVQSSLADWGINSDKYGDFRGTGALKIENNKWKIVQYNLLLPIPNDLLKKYASEIKEYYKSQ